MSRKKNPNKTNKLKKKTEYLHNLHKTENPHATTWQSPHLYHVPSDNHLIRRIIIIIL